MCNLWWRANKQTKTTRTTVFEDVKVDLLGSYCSDYNICRPLFASYVAAVLTLRCR